MDYYDVTVVGAGVCGLIVSQKIAEQGYRVCVIEAKQDVGIETKCSALYSVRGIKKLGLKLEDALILNVIRGGRFFSPSGKTITAHSNKDRAFVVEKKLFDKFLAREAAKSGVEFKFKTIAVEAKIDNEVKLKTEGLHHNIIKSKILVLAEGVKRRISKNLGFKSYNRFVSACRVEIDKAEIDEDIAEMYFTNKYAKGFYAWLLHRGETCEIGIGVERGDPWYYLMKFIRENSIANRKIKGKSFLEIARGFIPTDYPSECVRDRVAIVGDACAQNKASTGGGVVTGGICANILANACIKALENENFSKKFLKKEYKDKWREEIGKELEIHAMLREGFNSLSDEEIDTLFEIAISENLQDVLIKLPDTDRPSEFLNEIAKNDKLIEKFQRILNISIS